MDENINHVLKFLTADDQRLLFEKAERKTIARGELIFQQGERVYAICLVKKGTVLVSAEHMGGKVPLARLGAGEVFGEMSFVDDGTASATVTAFDEVTIDMIERSQVNSLLNSVPGFAARFYHSLAALLSQRVRSTNAAVVPSLGWS